MIDGVMAEVPERRSVETGKGILFWRDGFESTLCPYEEAENGSKDGTNLIRLSCWVSKVSKTGKYVVPTLGVTTVR